MKPSVFGLTGKYQHLPSMRAQLYTLYYDIFVRNEYSTFMLEIETCNKFKSSCSGKMF